MKMLDIGSKEQFKALLEMKAAKRRDTNPFASLAQGDDVFEQEVIKVEQDMLSLTEKWYGEESHEVATQHTYLGTFALFPA
jgi:hypothetical protein